MKARTTTGRGLSAWWGGCLVAVILGITLAAAPALADNKASSQALGWLGLIDQGKYSASWDKAAKFFQKAVTRDRWVQSLRGVRKPLGRLVSRQETSRNKTNRLPGAPEGQYVVLIYQTSFSNKSSTQETVTMMKEADGSWRASGYYIK